MIGDSLELPIAANDRAVPPVVSGKWAGKNKITSRPSWGLSLGLLLVVFALYLPGFFTLPAVDRDESRFAQASRQMRESGDYVVPTIQGKPRLNKPPLIYWLQVASARVFAPSSGDSIWMYRVPSLLAAIGAVLVTWRLGCLMFGPAAGLLAGFMIAASPVIFWEARQARADMVLLFFTTVAMSALWRLLGSSSHQDPAVIDRFRDPAGELKPKSAVNLVVLWAAIAAGILVKGPITPLVVVLTVLTLMVVTRRWNLIARLAPLMGVVVVLVVCLPWLLAVMNRVGPQNYLRTIYDETLGRSLGAKEGHSGPPGYHALVSFGLFLPGALTLGAAMVFGFRSLGQVKLWRRDHPLVTPPISPALFLTSWIALPWLVFELVSTKLPHYTMPLYPALALLGAGAIYQSGPWIERLRSRTWVKGVTLLWIIVLGGVSAACFAAASYIMSPGKNMGFLPIAVAATGVGYTLVTTSLLLRFRRSLQKLVAMGCAIFLINISLLVASLPMFQSIWTTRQLMRVIAPHDPTGTRPIIAVGYQEDSLIFETRGRAQRVTAMKLNELLALHPDALVVIDEPSLLLVPTELQSLGAVRSFNYSKGRWVNVVVGSQPERPSP